MRPERFTTWPLVAWTWLQNSFMRSLLGAFSESDAATLTSTVSVVRMRKRRSPNEPSRLWLHPVKPCASTLIAIDRECGTMAIEPQHDLSSAAARGER
jgi:hypothetical protein